MIAKLIEACNIQKAFYQVKIWIKLKAASISADKLKSPLSI